MSGDAPFPVSLSGGECARIDLWIVTGFLGSGKTTVLRRWLAGPAARDTAVIVNEIAAIGIDQDLIQAVDEDLYLLNSGCICCAVRDDFVAALRELERRRRAGGRIAYRRVVVETTGLADPGPIIHAVLNEPLFAAAYRLGGVVATIDATHAMGQLDAHEEAVRQAGMADLLLLTKTDLTPAAVVEPLESRLRALNPDAAIRRASFGAIEFVPGDGADDVFAWRFDGVPRRAAPTASAKHGDHGIAAVVIEIDQPVEWERFERWLQGLCLARGRDLLRLKGILHLVGGASPVAVHAVQFAIYPPIALDHLAGEAPRSRLAIIGRQLDRAVLTRTLKAALDLP